MIAPFLILNSRKLCVIFSQKLRFCASRALQLLLPMEIVQQVLERVAQAQQQE